MKYTKEITINLPRKRVIELFDNPDNLKKWQPGLLSFEHISGVPGQPGAKSRLKYKMGNREVEMIETITKRDLPDEFNGTYEAKGVHNTMKNRFFEIDDHTTRWIAETEFKFSGFMRLMGIFMRGAFPKETEKNMRRFKEFAEQADRE
jgi:carbon monoxide dehydrogenase subunit G